MAFCLLYLLLAAAVAQANDSPSLRIKREIVVDKVGDARVVLELRMPAGDYTRVKINHPNTAVLIRQLGMATSTGAEVENIKGQYEDDASMVRFEWTSRGFSRAAAEGAWHISVHGSALETVSVNDRLAIFNSVLQTYLGTALMTTHINIPGGADKLSMNNTAKRLSYILPATPEPTNGQVALEVSFQSKAQIMSCLTKLYANTRYSHLWLSKAVLKNTGTQTIKNFRVRFRVPEHTASWDRWHNSPVVLPGQTVVDLFYPVFDLDKMGQITVTKPATVEMEYEYQKPDGKIVRESNSRMFQILSRNEVFYSSLNPSSVVTWKDNFNYCPYILPAFVTRDDPIIQQVAGWVSGQDGPQAAAYSDKDATRFLRGFYDFLQANKIAYQTPPGAKFEGQFGQHLKYGRDVLRNRAGTCIDLAILFASACESVGLEPVLFVVPGHCFPAIILPESRRILAVESTMVNTQSFDKANTYAKKEVDDAYRDGRYYMIKIREQRDAGIAGIQLPALPTTTLADWGIRRIDRTSTTANTDANTSTPRSVVGQWNGQENLQGFGALGFRILQNGQVVMQDTRGETAGTWRLNGNQLTMWFHNNQTIYVGSLAGNAISGTARGNQGGSWNWTVSMR